MRIIQITDLHINTTNEPVNEVDTRANFINVLDEAAKFEPDMLVLTGDLSFDTGSEEVYKWIKKHLDDKGFKNYNIIGGNHDHVSVLAAAFGVSDKVMDDELFYFIAPNIIFLDTSKGYCNIGQLQWFKDKINTINDHVPLIFMHHPPFKAGVPHMDDAYAFQQSEIFEDICLQSKMLPNIFCGHYHNEISLINSGISVFITPSTYLQIGMNSDKFEIDHRFPAFRIIDLNKNFIKTTVRYVFDK